MNKIVYAGRTFTDDHITSGQCYLAQSLLSSALEINTFDFSVSYNDPSLKDYLLDSPLLYYQGDKLVGTYFVQEINRTSRLNYDFSCMSVVGLLDKAEHYGGIYTGQTVAQVAADICKGFPLVVASNVAKIKLYGWLPIASARENLAQVLFAISGTIQVGADSTITIKGLDDTEKSQVNGDRMSLDSSVQYDAPVTKVTILEHQYVKDTQTKKLFEGTTSANDRITFSEPMHSLTANGFSILQAGDNYAIVSAGSGTLSGQLYIHTTREVVGSTQARAALNVSNVIRVEDATLISLANSRAVADRLAEYYTHTEHILSDIDYQNEQAGDVVNIAHPYDGGMVQACLESVDITLSGRARAAVTALVGYLPPDISQIEYYDTFEVLTGAGTWVPPEKIRNLRAVLIGAGDSGTDGAAGSPGRGGHVTGRPELEEKGGEGGTAGTPGQGGRVLQVEITVAAQFVYSCGIGGKNGGKGTDTIFGEFSSKNGTASDNGFTEPMGKVTYARKGKAGRDGGKGGDAETEGAAVGGFAGGDAGIGDEYDGYTGRGGGGGGAANGNNGANAGNGRVDRRSNGAGGYYYHAVGGYGGNGADAVTEETRTEYGSGGNAGCGGGGGGGGGRAKGSTDTSSQDGRGGSGGRGSLGSAGRDGCIIVYYSKPEKG